MLQSQKLSKNSQKNMKFIWLKNERFDYNNLDLRVTLAWILGKHVEHESEARKSPTGS